MPANQQIENFITALEAADGVSVDADLTAESVTIEDDAGNQLAIDTSGTITVTDDGAFAINSLPEPVDVSAATVTVTDDGALDINSLPEPVTIVDDGDLIVSDILSTVTVTDDGALDVSSVGGVVTTTTGSTTNGSTYGVQQADTSPGQILAANENRESVLLQNKSNKPIYVGFDDSVSSLKGVEITAGGTYADDAYTGPLFAITNSGTANVAYQEIATE